METVKTVVAPANGGIPNHPRWPALLEADACPGGESQLRDVFADNGWGGMWTWSVFDYHHYHPASHEVLGVASGHAELHLGGPDGEIVTISKGDVLVLPAGFGHKLLSASEDFRVVGAYPPGQERPDILRAFDCGLDEVLKSIAAVPRPASDPAQGRDGPLAQHWN